MTHDAGYQCCAEYGRMQAEIARLRDTNQTLFESRQESFWRAERLRIRAEKAEDELASLRQKKASER